MLRCSSRLLLVPDTLTCHLLEQSGDSEVVAEDHHMFYVCFSAAIWDRFEVTAPGDCISAIKPKMVFRPTVLPAISFILGRTGGGHRRRPSFSSHGVVHPRTQRCSSSTSSTLFRPFLSWYGVDCQRGLVFFSFSGEPGDSEYRSDHSYRIWRAANLQCACFLAQCSSRCN